jgi:hypothetical protein
MPTVRWPEELIDELVRGRVVLFFGSGVSANSRSANGDKRPPTWYEFLESAVRRLKKSVRASVQELLARNNLLLACDVIREQLGREAFKRLLREQFHDPGYLASEVHKSLLRLDARITVTPNFDVIYDSFVQSETNNTVLIKNYYDDDAAESIRSKYPVVFKLHGTITSPDRLIFTASDYARARSEATDFYELIRALISTHTFLFLGCGLDDPDIKLLLEDYRYTHRIGAKHYFLIAKQSINAQVLKSIGESLSLNFVTYDNSEGTHSNFRAALQQLERSVSLLRST